MQGFIDQVGTTLGGNVLNIVYAILILLAGWIVALLVSSAVRAILNRTTIDDRIAASMGLGKGKNELQIEPIISRFVFWIVMLFAIVAFFQQLGLTIVTEPINNLLGQFVGFGSNLVAAGTLIFVAWILATGVRFILTKILSKTSLDDKLTNQAGLTEEGQTPMSEMLANVLYWFIILLFLPAILGALNMEGLLEPVQGLVSIVLAYIPNIVAAGIIILVGWLIARIVRKVVEGLLMAAGADKLGERVGMTSEEHGQSLSSLLGMIVYVLILLPTLIAGLQTLGIAAISDPATEMLSTLLLAIPAIFGATIILSVTYMVAKLVANLVTGLLKGIGFDRVLSLIGLGQDPKEGEWTPSEIAGHVVLVALMLFATIEAANLIGFTVFGELVTQFIEFGFQIIVALIIFGLGLFLANFAYKVILNTAGSHAKLLAQTSRMVIIIFVAAMAIRQVGIAEDIVNMAFGLSMGAVALAFALAFGLGSREVAGREMEGFISTFRSSAVSAQASTEAEADSASE